MAKLAEGYSEGWAQWTAEPDDEVVMCDECSDDTELYWVFEDEILCDDCFAKLEEN